MARPAESGHAATLRGHGRGVLWGVLKFSEVFPNTPGTLPKPLGVSSMYGFGDFRLEAGERRLWRGEASVALTPKTFDLLLFLVQNEGRLVKKDDLLAAVWPDATVEENNLTVAVSALRKALGESEAQRFIETVPKKGYRFVARVTKLRAEIPMFGRAFDPVKRPWRGAAENDEGKRTTPKIRFCGKSEPSAESGHIRDFLPAWRCWPV